MGDDSDVDSHDTVLYTPDPKMLKQGNNDKEEDFERPGEWMLFDDDVV